MPADHDQQSSYRSFIAVMLAMLFVCVCSAMLISQRLEIARQGKRIDQLHRREVILRTEQSYLELDVAERASFENLIGRMREFNLNLVPPEEIKALHVRQP